MNESTEIRGLLSQVKQAADKLKTRIHDLDSQIEALYSQRSDMMSGALSKSDYLAVIRADVQTKARPFAVRLRQHLETGNRVNYPAMAQASGGGLPVRYLDAGLNGRSDMAEEAYYFYFEDAIVAGVERALKAKQWPEVSIPATQRKEVLASLAVQIDGLAAERDALADELVACGLTG